MKRRFVRGLQFGLLHLLAGIPIAAALALSCGGWWFTWMYLRAYRNGGQPAGLAASTRVHLAYDIEIVLIVVGAIALGS